MSDYILELKNITKIFPGVKALDDVHFQLKQGEIHALMGENGAGKSTFIKVITGVHAPDGGEIILNGEKIVFANPKEAQSYSIAAIYQHGTVYPHLSVTENIFLGHEKTHPVTKMINWTQMHKDAKKLLTDLGSDIDPRTNMGNLSVAEQQIVEIAKAISTNAKIIIMDEPTAALSNRECEQLYKITLKLRDDGASIIFISHRFEDMYKLASRVTVLRDAKYIGTWGVDEISNEKLISAMVGREITQIYPKSEPKIGDELLRVENLSRTGYFKDISFSIRKGEIFALTGLVGAGRTEVCQTIFGIEKADSGKIMLEGKELHISHPSEAMRAGIGYLPEDRQKQGLILDWEIYKNETLATLEQFTKYTAINSKKERLKAKKLSEMISVKAVSVYDKASSLSGGNQQKVIFAKLLNSDLKLIILDEPTKGVDVGAKSQIYEIMSKLAQDGYGIIMVSSEMPEVLGVADTIGVMRAGKITAIFDRKDATQEKILAAAMQVNGGVPDGREE
ncbi:MAG: sugar ABC transporter ATP-binding protein [Bacillota bacterium]|nr:sugar ABC transporter ATP-binding protein [Bacillota bacterium]